MIKILLVLPLLISTPSWANIPESLSYFKDGVLLEHEPTHTKLRFNFRIQNLFTYETQEADTLSAESAEFMVRRLRTKLQGHVLDPRLIFKIELGYSRGDLAFESRQQPNILLDGVIGWEFSENTTLLFGQTKLPGNLQRLVSSGDLQLVDRSLVNSTFNIDRDQGVQLHHRFNEKRPVSIQLAISNGEGRASENENDGLAYTSRLEWLPFGKFEDGGHEFEADLAREENPKLLLGAAYSINKKAKRIGGQLRAEITTPELSRDIETWFLDSHFKYQGLSWYTEYAKRWSPDPVFLDGGSTVAVYKGEGFNTQVGYVMENDIEPVLRYTQIWADRETLLAENDEVQYTVGLSKYFNGHKVKVQSDLTYAEEKNRVLNEYSNSWIYRLQVELGI
jgi:phosphate-selective porin OprO/OprP